jgi:hypothetical protein
MMHLMQGVTDELVRSELADVKLQELVETINILSQRVGVPNVRARYKYSNSGAASLTKSSAKMSRTFSAPSKKKRKWCTNISRLQRTREFGSKT